MSLEKPQRFPNERPHSKPHGEEALSERPVLVDGRYMGREVRAFQLTDLAPSQIGAGGYSDVFFETASGNIYHVFPTAEGQVAIADARSNRGRREQQLRGVILSSAELRQGILEIGKRFKFGKGASSSEITKITAITGRQFITSRPDDATIRRIAKRETGGNVSTVKERFAQALGQMPLDEHK